MNDSLPAPPDSPAPMIEGDPWIAFYSPTPPSRPIDRAGLVQRVVLIAGTVCVLAAGGVFLTMSWKHLGALGQDALVVLATSLFALGSIVLGRRSLLMSAEAVGTVATGLLVFDACGIYRQVDGFDLGRWGFAAAAGAVLAVVLTGLARLAPTVHAYRIGACLSASFVPLAAQVQWGGSLEPAGALIVSFLTAAAFDQLARRTRSADVATTSAIVSLLWAGCGLAVVVAAIRTTSLAHLSVVATVAVAASLVAVVVLGRRSTAADGVAPYQGSTEDLVRITGYAVLAAALAAGATAAAGLAMNSGAIALTALVGGFAVLSTAWMALPPRFTAPGGVRRNWSLPTAALIGLTGLIGFCASLTSVGHIYLSIQMFAIAGALAMLAVRSEELREFAAGVSATLCLAATAVATTSGELELSHAALGISAAAALLGLISTALPDGTARLLQLLSAAGFVIAVTCALQAQAGGDAGGLVGSLFILSAGLAGYAVLTRNAWFGVGSSVAFAAAAVELSAMHGVMLIEAYTLPTSLVLAGVGALVWKGDRRASSWITCGPALATALGGSTLAVLLEPALEPRVVLTLVGVLVAVVTGFRLRLAAAIILAAVCGAVVAVSQLGPYAVGAPRWVTLGLVGLTLLAIGICFEQVRIGARAAGRWYADLH